MGIICIDFETNAIKPRPDYPPAPCGVAILENGKAEYLAWKHPVENNATWHRIAKTLERIWNSGQPLLFHNAKFDLEVANQFFGLPIPKVFHDTMILAYLNNPREEKLGLKELADKYLNLPPIEQDELREWILTNVNPRKKSQWGAYISEAPGRLVGKYARGDAIRTYELFQLWERLASTEAYKREIALIPILLEMELNGLPLDHDRLEQDTYVLEQAHVEISKYLKRKVGDVDLDSPKQLATALESNGYIKDWVLTPKGNKSTSKASLDIMLQDKEIKHALNYRRSLGTCIRTFMRPWSAQSKLLNGRMCCNWYQVRQPNERKRGVVGTRTGRLSSSPNFQNMPNPFKDISLPLELPNLPRMRSYIVPPEGSTLGQADYSQQELRILAHYTGGLLSEAYNHDSRIDVHSLAQRLINTRLGTNFERKPVKNTGFGLIYGMGLRRLADSMDSSIYEAEKLRDAYLSLFPGISSLYNTMEKRSRGRLPITTWGGRQYYCEDPKVVNNRWMTFEYKMVNVLIQGSAADATKEALVRYHAQKPSDVDIILTVHDEIVILIHSTNEEYIAEVMQHLSDVMCSLEFNVPMIADTKMSNVSFADLE